MNDQQKESSEKYLLYISLIGSMYTVQYINIDNWRPVGVAPTSAPTGV